MRQAFFMNCSFRSPKQPIAKKTESLRIANKLLVGSPSLIAHPQPERLHGRRRDGSRSTLPK